MSTYHTKYRPEIFEHMLGHNPQIRSIIDTLQKGSCKAFLLSGPSGVGKTTIARIIASHVDCVESNLLEIDAATHTGIDAMRQITHLLGFHGLGGKNKVVIVDEAHSLSKQAWQSLQKDVEEPPEHVWWVFCTTEFNKVPVTIRNRCACYALGLVYKELVLKLLQKVSGEEKLGVGEDILWAIAESSEGSPRRALTYLAECARCTDVKEAHVLMQTVTEGGEIIELCRALMKPGMDWQKAMSLIDKLDNPNPESIRMVILGYFTKVAKSAKSDRDAGRALAVLEAFKEPAYHISGIMRSFGYLIFEVN